MKRDPKIIVQEIISLVNELSGVMEMPERVLKRSPSISKKNDRSEGFSGATGGIRMLIEEGKFDEPRSLSDVGEYLRQEGRHYPKPSISMGLLNLVRERLLSRLPDKNKKWKYVVRK